mgnify:CR=1 FL=1
MAEQIILNTDLYDNLLTERKGDYTAKPRITGTLYNTDIAARIVAARTEYQHGTILNILDMADSHKVQATPRARAWWTAWANTSSTCRGLRGREGAVRTREARPRHHLHHGQALARDPQAGEGGGERRGGRRSGDQYRDRLHLQGHQRAAQLRRSLVLGGVNLKIQGDDPSIGVYLTPTTEGAAPMKAPVVIANSPSQVIVQMPTLADGQYTVSLTTQYSGSRNVKEPRTYTFPIILIVGEGGGGDSESPDEI